MALHGRRGPHDLDLFNEAYVADDAEYVTRQGTFRGPDRWLSELKVQADNFDFEIEEVIDGKVVFFEGYIDRRKALADFGIEQG